MQIRTFARADEKKRTHVFAQPRRVVKFCLHGGNGTLGLPHDPTYDQAAEDAKFATQAKERALNPFLYRNGRPDSGYQWANDEADVRIDQLLQELADMGFRCISAGWHSRKDGTRINVLTFALEGDAIDMTNQVKAALRETMRRCTVWMNWEQGPDGKWFRSDSINLNQWRGTDALKKKRVRRIILGGEKHGSYQFVAAKRRELSA